MYLPDEKASLYPPALSEAAASLLPDGPRPAVVFVVRVDADGDSTLDGAERAMIRSWAKLAYDSVTADDGPEGFAELARRISVAEDRRPTRPSAGFVTRRGRSISTGPTACPWRSSSGRCRSQGGGVPPGDAPQVDPGDEIRVKLVAADPTERRVDFERVG